MKLGWFLAACGLLVALAPVSVEAQEAWRIADFSSDIAIQEDGRVAVTETITVDFGSLAKHGIYRDLPVVYDDGGDSFYTRIDDIAVQQDGQPAEVDITRNAANMRIRIGDPDRTITGPHEYVISYTATGALQSFEGFDELNWNVTGNDWEVPIEHAAATITIPAEVTQAACYQGSFGATQPCDELVQSDTTVAAQAEDLAMGEGLTVAVGYEPGVVPILTVTPPPSPADIIAAPTTWIVGGVTFVLVAGWLIRRWWQYGRDRYWQRAHLPGVSSQRGEESLPEKIVPFGYKKPVVAEYDPPDGLRPAEIGVLMDERADTLDVSATIVDLASRGYLTITEEPKSWLFGKTDYVFIRTNKAAGDMLDYEQQLLKYLFDSGKTAKLSDLKNSFYKDLAKVKDALYEEVARKKLFPKRPDTARGTAALLVGALLIPGGVLIGAGLMLLSNTGAVSLLQYVLVGVGGGLLPAAAVAAILAPRMPRKTALGRELYERSQGYELFVSGTEKYRARWMEDEGLFERVLPYAIMFGVTDKLAKAFKDMGIEPRQPSWYHGAVAFNAASFATSLNDFSTSLSSAMASKPGGSGGSSGGGGFSGGGFGGGGGGSW